jgi:hypothetical protein
MAKDPCKGMEAIVQQIVGRLHVGESDDAAADYVVSRLRKGVDEKTKRQVRKCAIKLHRANRNLYRQVMR